jgi:hypothetical protein
MSVGESLVVGLITMALVFAVLVILYAMIMLLAVILKPRAREKAVEIKKDFAPVTSSIGMEAVQTSFGEVRLKDVDERTAAMVMAIVSDESQIPLSELRFKSIKAVE